MGLLLDVKGELLILRQTHCARMEIVIEIVGSKRTRPRNLARAIHLKFSSVKLSTELFQQKKLLTLSVYAYS